jgi:hypothetical protein
MRVVARDSDPYSFIWIRIQHFRLNTDPDPIWIQGFDDQKIEKNLQLNKKNFWIKNFNLPIQGLHKGRPDYRRSLQISKRTSITSKHEISFFSTFVGHFCPPGSGSGSTDLIVSGSNTDPDPKPLSRQVTFFRYSFRNFFKYPPIFLAVCANPTLLH